MAKLLCPSRLLSVAKRRGRPLPAYEMTSRRCSTALATLVLCVDTSALMQWRARPVSMSLLPRRPPFLPVLLPGALAVAAAGGAASTLAAAALADRVSLEGLIAEVPASALAQRLDGRTAIVTGANTGIGFETAAALARAGADVVLACRDPTKGARAASEINAAVGGACVEAATLDLGSLASVRAFAEQFRARDAASAAPLSVLVNNAGIMRQPFSSTDRRVTADGFEEMAGVNHLGHYHLTRLLLEGRDAAAPPCRVVTVASVAHASGEIDTFDFNLVSPGRYNAGRAYAQSKLANILFTSELQRRYGDVGVTAVACHPVRGDALRSRVLERAVTTSSAVGRVCGFACPPPVRAGNAFAAISLLVLRGIVPPPPTRGKRVAASPHLAGNASLRQSLVLSFSRPIWISGCAGHRPLRALHARPPGRARAAARAACVPAHKVVRAGRRDVDVSRARTGRRAQRGRLLRRVPRGAAHWQRGRRDRRGDSAQALGALRGAHRRRRVHGRRVRRRPRGSRRGCGAADRRGGGHICLKPTGRLSEGGRQPIYMFQYIS